MEWDEMGWDGVGWDGMVVPRPRLSWVMGCGGRKEGVPTHLEEVEQHGVGGGSRVVMAVAVVAAVLAVTRRRRQPVQS